MAEYGAHLTSTRLNDPNKPSVFEVLAQENLTATIRPAFRHAVKVFAEKYPAQLGPLIRFYDEIFLVLDSLLQHHYLKVWGASFAENFYGLQRVSSGDNASKSKAGLDKTSRLHSLACLVLIPYLRTKLDSMFEDLQYKYPGIQWKSFIQPKLSLQQRLSMLYLCVYPHVRSSWEFVRLLYQMSYMLKNGRWHSPSMHLAGVELTRATEEIGSNVTETDDDISFTMSEKLRRLLKLSASTAATCLSYSVSVSVFFLQFLDWWYTTDARAPSLTALPIPNPPQNENRRDSISPGQCPLCMKQTTNSTALSVSGFVFCYRCIHQYVRDNKCCPLSGYTCSVENLVKIYEQEV